jgi:hypothetical protein
MSFIVGAVMKTITLRICPTVEANRDQSILENHGIRAVVVPHYKAPSFYVGDNQISELLVLEDQEDNSRNILGLPDPEAD